MKYISMAFEDDLHRDDVEALKTVRGCMGVSAYKNTVNLYFRHLDHTVLASLAIAVHRKLAYTGTHVALTNTVLDGESSTNMIYQALRDEAVV